MDPARTSIETLLTHADWIRGLALSLVRDPHQAQDLVQETWLTALRNPPRDLESPRGWLLRVIINLNRRVGNQARSRRRREEHRSVPEDATLGSAEEVFARVCVQRDIARAVTELGEPYRSTILLRYFEELPPREVAARMDVPVRTVNTRIARGLNQLRARLEKQYGEDRRTLAVGLLTLAGVDLPSDAGSLAGAAAGTTALSSSLLKIVVAAAVLLAVLLGGWLVVRDRDGATPAAPRLADGGSPSRTGGEVFDLDAAIDSTLADEPGADAGDAGGSDPSPTMALTGRVILEEDGSPVEGAVVVGYVSPFRESSRIERTTDASGEFRLPVPDEDALVMALEVLPTATTTRRYQNVNRRVFEIEEAIALPVSRGGTVRGRVLDQDGAPVEGCDVVAWCLPEYRVDSPPPPERSAVTDESGEFEIRHLGTEFTVEAVHPGMVCVQRLHGELASLHVAEELTLILSPGHEIHGEIRDPAGELVSDALLAVEGGSSQRKATAEPGVFTIGWRRARARSLADGSFTFRVPTLDTLVLRAEHDRYPTLRERFPFLDGVLSLQFETGATASVRVVNPGGDPVAGAQVALHGTEPNHAETDENGLCSFEGLESDQDWYLMVSAGGYAMKVVQPLTVREDRSSAVEVYLEREHVLAGVVRDANGDPVPRVTVRIEGERMIEVPYEVSPPPTWESWFGLDELRTDARGRFRFDRLYPGEFKLRAIHPERRDLVQETTTEAGNQDLEIVLEKDSSSLVSFMGILRSTATGEPIPAFSIRIRRPENGSSPRAEHHFSAGDGRFRVPGQRAGEMVLEFIAPGFVAKETEPRSYPPGGHDISTTLFPTRTLRFRVLDHRGRFCSGSASFVDPEGRELFVSSGPKGRANTVQFRGEQVTVAAGLPATLVTIRLSSAGHGRKEIELDLSSPLLDVLDFFLDGN